MAGSAGRRATRGALRIASYYGVAGLTWIAASDPLIAQFSNGESVGLGLSLAKGLGFVAVTAFVLYFLLQPILWRLHASRQALTESNERLELALDASALGFWDWWRDVDSLHFSATGLKLTGIEGGEGSMTGAEWLARLHPDDRNHVIDAVNAHLRGETERYVVSYRSPTNDGGYRCLLSRGQALRDDNGYAYRMLGTVSDITDRREREEYLRQAAAVFESTTEGIIVTDPQTRILRVNRAFTEITGYPAEEVVGSTPAVLSSGLQDEGFYGEMWHALRQTGRWEGEIWNRRRDGDVYPERLMINAVYDDAGEVSHYIGVFSDISAAKESEAQLEYVANYDSITELPNRRLLESRLEQAAQRCSQAQARLAVVAVDLDRFKTINESMGHPFGDAVLRAVARRLQDVVRAHDVVARFGGDEFVLLVEGVTSTDSVVALAGRISEQVSRPIRLWGEEIFVTPSIGVTLCPDDGADATTLIKNADSARYAAKRAGGGGYRFYSAELSEEAEQYLSVESGLHRALRESEFELYYQPQIDLVTGALEGAEALIRWNHPQHGLLAPGWFLPVAEASGLIERLDTWSLEHAVAQAGRWQRAGYTGLRVAVNLSAARSLGEGLVSQVRRLLERSGLHPGNLELEVTESSLMTDPEAASRILGVLRQIGVQIAVDDFGTGYSSLSHLSRFPVDRLKIDKSFIQALPGDTSNASIVSSIVVLGRGLGMKVLAEGVETPAQRAHLEREGCHAIQGYLIGKPMPAQAFEAYMARHHVSYEPYYPTH